jgi:hypothetical protein
VGGQPWYAGWRTLESWLFTQATGRPDNVPRSRPPIPVRAVDDAAGPREPAENFRRTCQDPIIPHDLYLNGDSRAPASRERRSMHATIQIEVNGHPHYVHHETRTGAEIKALGHHAHGTLFRLEGEARHLIGDDELVHLHNHERFVVANEEQVTITINVDGTDFPVHHRQRTGAEIKALAHRPAGNRLYRLEGTQLIKIADDETVHLHDCERFKTMPPHGHTS